MSAKTLKVLLKFSLINAEKLWPTQTTILKKKLNKCLTVTLSACCW